MRESFRKWQSPSDPSTNHNTACNLQYDGTAEWFFADNTFEEWKTTGSLLWIHGKRTLLLTLDCSRDLTSHCVAGSGKSVLWLVIL